MKIVEVKWLDAMGTSGWRRKDEEFNSKDAMNYSVGYLKEKTNEQIVICLSDGVFCHGDVMQIPTACIKRVRVIGKSAKDG